MDDSSNDRYGALDMAPAGTTQHATLGCQTALELRFNIGGPAAAAQPEGCSRWRPAWLLRVRSETRERLPSGAAAACGDVSAS